MFSKDFYGERLFAKHHYVQKDISLSEEGLFQYYFLL